MNVGKFLFGSSPKYKQRSNLTGSQGDLLNDLIQKVMAGEGGFGFDEDFFQQGYVDPALQEFQSRTAPAIQQRFASRGLSGSQVMNDYLARAGTDLQGNLNRQRADLMNQALDRQLRGAQQALGTQAFSNEFVPGTRGLIPEVLSSAAGGITGGFSNPFGSALAQGASRYMNPQQQNQGFRR